MEQTVEMLISENLERELQSFPATGRPLLVDLVTAPAFTGIISAAEARTLAAQTGLAPDRLLVALVPIARAYAHPPISGYHVGATIRGKSGDIIMGGNLEFPGLALNMTIHGEQAAVLHALAHGETGIAALAVNGTPCGHCRQLLAEVNDPDLELVSPRGVQPFAIALPDAFMPRALGNEAGLFDPVDNPLPPLPEPANALAKAAWQAARRSYAPYSSNWSGAAVRTSSGELFTAPYVESVAFNPSLNPLQGILVAMRQRRLDWGSITAATLVEAGDSLASQAPAVEALLGTLTDAQLAIIRP